MNARYNPSWSNDISEFAATRRNLPHFDSPGSWYAAESNTYDRHVLSPEERDIVFDAIQFLDGKKYDLRAVVVVPDHFHLIIHPLIKKGDACFSLREIFHSIKSFSAMKILQSRGIATRGRDLALDSHLYEEAAETSMKRPGTDMHIWQGERYDHIIRNEKDYLEQLRYLIMNPVEAGIVEMWQDYKWLWFVKD